MAGKSKTKYSGGVKQDRKILLLLAAVILIPVLLYTGLELSRVRERENLLRESYRAQLKAILFSVNQRCWDTVESWGNHLRMITQRSSPRVEPQELSALLGGRVPVAFSCFRRSHGGNHRLRHAADGQCYRAGLRRGAAGKARISVHDRGILARRIACFRSSLRQRRIGRGIKCQNHKECHCPGHGAGRRRNH